MMDQIVASPPGTVSDWTDDQWTNFKWWLENLLRGEVVEIIFTKTDGSERVMRCTMDPLVVAAGVKILEERRSRAVTSTGGDVPSKNSRPKPKERLENITVWDVEAEDWRSFKIRSLTNILTLIIKYDYREPNLGEFEVVFS
jgi:hypothetical protein